MPENNQLQINFPLDERSREEILSAIQNLFKYHKSGLLKGEVMPEDSNPGLPLGSRENLLYFTLPMALNFQRNSYNLWKSAKATYEDEELRSVFFPEVVVEMSEEELREVLLKNKIALQPNKHIQIWKRISEALFTDFNSDVRELFAQDKNDIKKILETVQKVKKKSFPYLSGPKICNYWLYVMTQYTNLSFSNRESLSIAPDTHVIQASQRLGLIAHIGDQNKIRDEVAKAWINLLDGTGIAPIDVHTPLWLWSRNRFSPNPFD